MGSPRGLRGAEDDDDPLSVMALGLGLARSLYEPFDVVRSMKKKKKKREEGTRRKKDGKRDERKTDADAAPLGLAAAAVVVFTLTVEGLASLVFPVVFLGALRVSVAFFLGATFKGRVLVFSTILLGQTPGKEKCRSLQGRLLGTTGERERGREVGLCVYVCFWYGPSSSP